MAKILAVILPEHDRRQWRKSTRSAANGCCVEVAFRKSSHSTNNGACVEAATCPPGHVLVRDSKDPDGPVLSFSGAAWAAFLADVKNC